MSRLFRSSVLAGGAASVAGLVYSAGYEARAFRLRRFVVPVLPPGADPVRVLHVSDLHLTPGQRKKIAWVRGLGDLRPDLVVDTGDNLAHPKAVPALLEAFEPLLDLPGVSVLGSNDYFAPQPKSPTRYLTKPRPEVRNPAMLPWQDMRDAFAERGWLDLTNTTGTIDVRGVRIGFVGVDDPHLERDRLDLVTGRPVVDSDLRVGVAHAPYLRVLDAFAADGCRLILAGHTHGGQLCVPGYGALVTNCDLEPARAKGLHRHPAQPASADARDSGRDARSGADGDGRPWLHVCAGLGTSPYTPVRFACFPEASLLTLVARG